MSRCRGRTLRPTHHARWTALTSVAVAPPRLPPATCTAHALIGARMHDPCTYVKQLRAIIGIEMAIETVEGKAKLSQNRSEEDRSGVIEGLRSEGGAGSTRWPTRWHGSTDLASAHRGSPAMRRLGSIHASSPANAGTPAALHPLGHDAAGPPAVRPRVPSSPDRRGRRRGDRGLVLALLAAHPDPGSNVVLRRDPGARRGVGRRRVRLGAAAPRPRRHRPRPTWPPRPVVQPILVGARPLGSCSSSGAFVVQADPAAGRPGRATCSRYANEGTRRWCCSWSPWSTGSRRRCSSAGRCTPRSRSHQVLITTVAYTIATAATGNVMLGFAAHPARRRRRSPAPRQRRHPGADPHPPRLVGDDALRAAGDPDLIRQASALLERAAHRLGVRHRLAGHDLADRLLA